VCDVFATIVEDNGPSAYPSDEPSVSSIFEIRHCTLLLGADQIKSARDLRNLSKEKQLIKEPSKYDTSPFYEIIIITQFFLQYASAIFAGILNLLVVSKLVPCCKVLHSEKANPISYRFTCFLCYAVSMDFIGLTLQ